MTVRGKVKGKTYDEWQNRYKELDDFLNIVKQKGMNWQNSGLTTKVKEPANCRLQNLFL